MADCCSNAGCEIEKLRERQRSTLVIVLVLNAVMFVVELTAGLMAHSTALLADSLDMLGDALVYAFSIYVVTRSDVWKAISAMLKGGIMALFGIFVVIEAIYKMMTPLVPTAETIGIIGVIALLVNAICLSLLWRHRGEDINMRSVWLCSRNDIIANIAVLIAAVAVWLLQSKWPDIIVGLMIAALFLRSAWHVLHDARQSYNKASTAIPLNIPSITKIPRD